ncbi:MAG: helix-turn-helix domain-containing protein [Chloroflexi bacterium]|nr:helix-turn-helix domain-containing protein [Chloroflexota bacterium]
MRSFLTATEFARIIQKDKKTVIRWVQKNLIPGAKRVGHLYQIPIREVEVFQNSPQYPLKQWQK